ncbi:NERD domain-containing protein [Chryseobacterium arthrosphaerae]|uniref:NERD domain-containing protein n=1 Tax=Chryseobacterium arthrosphaerae TaxID=651561 RepID=UPI001F4A496D|nr:NERD domain-containing protein [Chryseobacterium arthrosphaerae]MDG4654930.1 NERD domain-containing protein [Chryseobacterium arthrosphaerae]
MLEIRKGTATKNYENTFFREFADNLKKMFDKYSLDGLLIANSECEAEKRLQIDALLVTEKAVLIIDFKNFGGKIILPKNAKSEFAFGVWTNENGEPIKGGSSINPFMQLKTQKERFIKVVEKNILPKLSKSDYFNAFHTVRAVCFQKSIGLNGKIPSNEELNFFIFDKNTYLETIKDIIDISDKQVSISKNSFDIFKEVFRANLFDTSEKYDQASNFTSYHTELDFDNLYPDQKSALNEIENFIKSDKEKIFILQGTSLSGKTHLIPFIHEVAFNNQITEVKLFASSSRISNNLLKSSNLEFESIYSYIYGGNSTIINEQESEEKSEEENENSLNLEVVPLLKSDDTEEAIFIVDEAHLISDNYHQSVDLRFGSGKLLKDFLEFSDLKNSKRKVIFIGDSFQLSLGKKEEASLNPEYLNEEYGFKNKAFQLIDKENKSVIVSEALKAVNCIRQQSFNNLSFSFSENIRTLAKEDLKTEIESSLNTNSHILCYSNSDAQKVNYWIKNSILKNGNDLTKDDFVIFGNNIRVEDENDPFAEPKKIYNGQFGTILNVADLITKDVKLPTPLYFRETKIQLKETNHILTFLSFENFRLSDKGELSKEEIISFYILLNQLAEKEIFNFKSGKYYADEDLKSLLEKYDPKTRKGITKLQKALQKHLRNVPSSEYYKFKNSAQIRFAWALTVHKSMSYKWNEIYFNVETGGGKTNETYFKWIYTGLIRATQKVSLINYEPIIPFFKLTINPAVPQIGIGQEWFYIADTTADLSNLNKITSEKYKFPDIENKSSLLQLYQFVENKIAQNNLSINLINHPNYQELYEIKGNSSEVATISIYYNNRGQFRMPTLMKSTPKEFGEELINLLKSENQISDFAFIQSNWRKSAYEQLYQKLKSKEIGFGYIIQVPYKDTIQFNNGTEALVADLYYDGDGFFTSMIAISCTNIDFWTEIQNVFNDLKENLT